jgi:hypothetical protein
MVPYAYAERDTYRGEGLSVSLNNAEERQFDWTTRSAPLGDIFWGGSK